MPPLSEYARSIRVRMLHDYVLVEMLEDRLVLSLIVAPASSYKRPDRARVIAAGPESGLHEGAEVIVDPYRFVLVLADGALANSERTPFAGIGDRAVIKAEHVLVVRVPDGEGNSP